MGTIRPYKGKHRTTYRAEVWAHGVRDSATFDTRTDAKAWMAQREAELRAVAKPATNVATKATVRDLLDRYAEEVSPTKRGARWEVIRLRRIAQAELASVPLKDLSATHIARWRDERLQAVSSGSVRREMVLLSGVFNVAIREWRMLAENPVKGIRWPASPPPRNRRVTDPEIDAILRACGYERGAVPETQTQLVGWCALWAVETAMRAGEIVRVLDNSGDVCTEKCTCDIREGKTGARVIPLTPDAVRLWGLRGALSISASNLDALFRKAKKRALLSGFTFHDLRAEALTRLSRRVDVLTLARISGHKDLRILLETYYRESAEEIARRL